MVFKKYLFIFIYIYIYFSIAAIAINLQSQDGIIKEDVEWISHNTEEKEDCDYDEENIYFYDYSLENRLLVAANGIELPPIPPSNIIKMGNLNVLNNMLFTDHVSTANDIGLCYHFVDFSLNKQYCHYWCELTYEYNNIRGFGLSDKVIGLSYYSYQFFFNEELNNFKNKIKMEISNVVDLTIIGGNDRDELKYQIESALDLLRINGYLICVISSKINKEIFYSMSVLYRSFEEVCLCKPISSYGCLNERFLICKNFKIKQTYSSIIDRKFLNYVLNNNNNSLEKELYSLKNEWVEESDFSIYLPKTYQVISVVDPSAIYLRMACEHNFEIFNKPPEQLENLLELNPVENFIIYLTMRFNFFLIQTRNLILYKWKGGDSALIQKFSIDGFTIPPQTVIFVEEVKWNDLETKKSQKCYEIIDVLFFKGMSVKDSSHETRQMLIESILDTSLKIGFKNLRSKKFYNLMDITHIFNNCESIKTNLPKYIENGKYINNPSGIVIFNKFSEDFYSREANKKIWFFKKQKKDFGDSLLITKKEILTFLLGG